MTNVVETLHQYREVCKTEKVIPELHVVRILKREEEQSKRRSNEKYNLYLAGNNKHYTDKRLTDKDAQMLYMTLRNNLFVNSLDLRYNNITDIGAQHIAALIQETVSLQKLNLMFNDINETGAIVISHSMEKNETIRSLRMTGNKMGNKGGMAFAQMLQVNTRLESLDMGDTDLEIQSLIAFSTVLLQNSTLKALVVNRPLLFTKQEEPTIHFAKTLKINKTLKELHLGKFDMRDHGAEWLADNLQNNFTITYLNLTCNRISQDGVKHLTKVLMNNTNLKVLDLSNNEIKDAGLIYLANTLAGLNVNLTTLDVSYNQINGEGLCALADCLRINTTLDNIYIWGNNLEHSAAIAFGRLLDNGRLDRKNVDFDSYTADGQTILSRVSNTIRPHYYWGASYGENPQPELYELLK